MPLLYIFLGGGGGGISLQLTMSSRKDVSLERIVEGRKAIQGKECFNENFKALLPLKCF